MNTHKDKGEGKKFKFVKNPHISLENKELCGDKDCKNVHLWFNKRYGMEQYAVSFIDLYTGMPMWCLGKEVCIQEDGLIREITSKLEEPGRLSIELSKDFFNEIFKGNEKNWKLHLW